MGLRGRLPAQIVLVQKNIFLEPLHNQHKYLLGILFLFSFKFQTPPHAGHLKDGRYSHHAEQDETRAAIGSVIQDEIKETLLIGVIYMRVL